MSDPTPGVTINEYGFWVNANGEYVDEQGNKVATPVKANVPQHPPQTPPATPTSGTDQAPSKPTER